jgi:DNA-binding response OmpR family regulator
LHVQIRRTADKREPGLILTVAVMKANTTSSRTRVLIVDSEPCLAAPLRFRLEREGVDVVVTYASSAALEHVERNPPALVVLDFELPEGASGLRLAETLRREHDVRSIFYTASLDAQLRAGAQAVGAVATLLRDSQLEDLVAVVRSSLSQIDGAGDPSRRPGSPPHAWEARAKREHLCGIYTAVWSETPEQVKSCLNRFSRSHNVSLEQLADAQATYQRQIAELHREYREKAAALRPRELTALHLFHERQQQNDVPLRVVPDENTRTGFLRRPA